MVFATEVICRRMQLCIGDWIGRFRAPLSVDSAGWLL